LLVIKNYIKKFKFIIDDLQMKLMEIYIFKDFLEFLPVKAMETDVLGRP